METKKLGRPRKDPTRIIALRLHMSEFDRLTLLAKKLDRSRSAVGSKALLMGLDRIALEPWPIGGKK